MLLSAQALNSSLSTASSSGLVVVIVIACTDRGQYRRGNSMNTTVYTWAGERLSARQQSEARGSHTTQIETWDDPLQDLLQVVPSHGIEEAPDAFDFLTSLGAPPGEKEACL